MKGVLVIIVIIFLAGAAGKGWLDGPINDIFPSDHKAKVERHEKYCHAHPGKCKPKSGARSLVAPGLPTSVSRPGE